MAEVKPEIKIDPADSPSKLADIDEFEEDTDLAFPTPADESKGAWLIKVSEDLWKAWNNIYQNAPDDELIEVGKLRVYHQQPGQNEQKAQIRLRDEREEPRLQVHKGMPKVYDLEMKATEYNNTIVFSEKDLPGHKSHPFGNRNLTAGKPTGINKNDRYGQRKPGTYRTAIPKQTALQPPVVNEAIANAVDDPSTIDLFKFAYDKALQGGVKTKFVDKIDRNKWHPSATAQGFTFGSMTSKPGGKKNKQAKEKAVRMSQPELIDALQKCFKEYQYWSMKALRTRLQQPEAYIKETLEPMALLVKSGDFVGNYKLNPNTAKMLNIEDGSGVKQEAAVVKSEAESDQGTGDELDEDDDDLDMDDVQM